MNNCRTFQGWSMLLPFWVTLCFSPGQLLFRHAWNGSFWNTEKYYLLLEIENFFHFVDFFYLITIYRCSWSGATILKLSIFWTKLIAIYASYWCIFYIELLNNYVFLVVRIFLVVRMACSRRLARQKPIKTKIW